MASSMSAVAEVSRAKFVGLPSIVFPCFRFICLEGKDLRAFHIRGRWSRSFL